MSVQLNEMQLQGIHEQINVPAVREAHNCKNLSYDRFKLLVKSLITQGVLDASAINQNQFDEAAFFVNVLESYPELRFSGSYVEEETESGGGFGKFLFLLIILGGAGYAVYHFWDKIKELIPK